MPPTCHPCLRRATTSVMVTVALVSGAILVLGDRFDAPPGYALTQPPRVAASIAACVTDESMRLINSDQEQCRAGEAELTSDHSAPGPTGRAGADGVSGFEIVTAKVAVTSRQVASGEARCPAGKVALGGGVLPDPESPRKAGAPEDRMDVVVSAPLLPGGDAGYGWTATVRNTGTAQLSVVVAAICVTLR